MIDHNLFAKMTRIEWISDIILKNPLNPRMLIGGTEPAAVSIMLLPLDGYGDGGLGSDLRTGMHVTITPDATPYAPAKICFLEGNGGECGLSECLEIVDKVIRTPLENLPLLIPYIGPVEWVTQGISKFIRWRLETAI